MQRYIRIIATFFVILLLAAYGFPLETDSLSLEVLLNSKTLSDIQVNEPFINSLAITSNKLVLLSTTDQFYLLGWGGLAPLGKKVTGPISSYAYTPDGLLIAIRNNELCVFDSLGNLSNLFGLPSKAMGIAAGKNLMYVFDRSKDRQKNALYVIAKGGNYIKLFEIPTAINSVVEINNTIMFATGSALFSYDIKNKELKALVALEKNNEIISIAVDESSNRIYFSTDSMFYALKDIGAEIISDKFGGVLRYFDNGLIVFNPDKKLLIRIVGLGEKKVIGE